jgi:hypothetical protein
MNRLQDLGDNIKRPNLQLMDMEEKEEQAKAIGKIFNKVRAENFPHFKKELVIQVQETFRTSKRLDQNTTYPCHTVVKTLSIQNKNTKCCKREVPHHL